MKVSDGRLYVYVHPQKLEILWELFSGLESNLYVATLEPLKLFRFLYSDSASPKRR